MSLPDVQSTKPNRCICTKTNKVRQPILQIKEMNHIPGAFNRGVVTRSLIKENQVLGELSGLFVHNDDDATEPSSAHRVQWAAPMELNEETRTWYRKYDVCGLVSGTRGNWTRFLNTDDDKGRHNVDIDIHACAGQLRYLAIASRDIKFGEELLIDYDSDEEL